MLPWLRSLLAHFRHSLHVLRRTKGSTTAAVLTLALGIGATTAVFSVVQGVVLAPLPYNHPDRLALVLLYNQTLKRPIYTSYSDFVDWRRNTHSFQGMAAFTEQDHNLVSPGTPEHLNGQQISSGFFETLGVKLALGREFTSREDVRGGAPAAIISNRLWQNRFGQNRNAIGRLVTLDGVDYTIVGILPPGFHFLSDADVYTPLGQAVPVELGDRATHDIACLARLKSSVNITQAQAEMNAVQQHLDQLYPSQERGLGAKILPLKQEIIGDVSGTLFLLFGAVAILLLISCANVANLWLARSVARTREFAIRSALGASRARILQQSIAESVLLSITGAVLGLTVAKWGIAPLLAMFPAGLPRSENIGLNAPVLLFAVGVALLVAIVSGIGPAIKNSSFNLRTSIAKDSRTGTQTHSAVQKGFVVVQMALALTLLVGAGLLFRTVQHLWHANPGFDPRNLITFKVGLSPSVTNSPSKMRTAYQQLIEHIRALPGVEAAALTTLVPFSGQEDELPFWTTSQPPASIAEAPRAQSYSVGPDYLKAMKIPLLQGRFFTPQDTTQSTPVLVVDSNMAHAYFPNTNPVGQTLSLVHVGRFQIIGVVGHVQHRGLEQGNTSSVYQVYGSLYQISDLWLPRMSGDVTVVVRTGLSLATILPSVKAAVSEASSGQPVYQIRTMQQFAMQSMPQRFPLMLMGAFAVLALLLACVGTYSVISYSVMQRVREIGIRIALGAQRPDVFRMVVGEGLQLALAGMITGGFMAVVLTRIVSSFSRLLEGVNSTDPITFASVSVLLISVAVLACVLPARRAMHVDPITAIRYE